MEVKFIYCVSPAVTNREFVHDGQARNVRRSQTCRIEDIPGGVRQLMLDSGIDPIGPFGKGRSEIDIVLKTYEAEDDSCGGGIREREAIFDSSEPPLIELLDAFAQSVAQKKAAEEQLKGYRAAYKQKKDEGARAKQEETEWVAAETAVRKERLETAKKEWIAEHGSEYLRRAFDGGYNCQRLYAGERAAQEFPDFALDFDETAEWKSRVCPSENALDVVDGIKSQHPNCDVRIVWLTTPVGGFDDTEGYGRYWEECEAVVVRDFLEAYTLVREV